jgi:sec-independent protein translocase protein TatA
MIKDRMVCMFKDIVNEGSINLRRSYMFGLGWPEVVIIVIAALFIFGPKKIPEIGGALGKTLRGFKEEIDETQQDSTKIDPDP